MALEITDASYEAKMAEGLPVIIDFWATWCGPCQMVGPMINELADEYAGRIIVGKIDVDANSEIPSQYGVRNIPTILFFNKNGEVVKKLVGVQTKAVLREEAEKLLQ